MLFDQFKNSLPVKKIRGWLGISAEQRNFQFHLRRSSEMILNYLHSDQAEKYLQIGCQNQLIDGWLNVDLLPKNLDVIFMDATKPFPFPDKSFDCIFSEHMIEHITLDEGKFMINECYRVLKPGGRLRITTPDLNFLIQLYLHPEQELHIRYVKFSERYFSKKPAVIDTVVINNFFRDWGHQFIHDKKSLSWIFQNAGFKKVSFPCVYESEDDRLRNLEKHGQEITEEFNLLETIVAEAQK